MTVEQSTEIEILPAARPLQSDAIGQLMAHADAMAAAKQLGDALAGTDLVPATYKDKPGNAAAAILYGAELGLNPIQSLQQIFVVHGSPAIYARTAVALVKRAGILVETVSTDDSAVTVRGTDTRTGQVEESTWDIPRATLAGYTKNAKYQTDPQAMLYAKAAMEVCRKIAPDVLLGIPYSREELDLEHAPAPRRVPSQRRGVEGLRAAISTPAVEVVEGVAVTDPHSDVPTVNPAQLKKLAILRKAERYEDDDQGRADWFAWVSTTVGRPIADSNKELTKDEASKIIDVLESAQQGGAA